MGFSLCGSLNIALFKSNNAQCNGSNVKIVCDDDDDGDGRGGPFLSCCLSDALHDTE